MSFFWTKTRICSHCFGLYAFMGDYYCVLKLAQDTLKEDLFAWWDSDLNMPNEIPAYITSVTGRSGDSTTLYNLTLTGSAYESLLQQKQVSIKTFNASDVSVPTPQNPLPFGGFPGTDKYGN